MTAHVGWGQDSCHSTMAHYFRDGKPVCGATTCNNSPYDGNGRFNFTGFCVSCSIKVEGSNIPKWALNAEDDFKITVSSARHQ